MRPRLAPAVAALAVLLGWLVTRSASSSGLPLAIVARGALEGLALALPVVAVCLAWRVDRVITFATGGIGGLGAVVAVGLGERFAVPWMVCMAAGLTAGALAGGLVGLAVLRFGSSPRLAPLVVTVGLGAVAAGGAGLAAQAFAHDTPEGGFSSPLHVSFTWDSVTFDGDAVTTLVLSVVALAVAIGWLARSRSGLAVRAVGASRERARLAGVPVARVSVLVWSLGGSLAALALVLRESLTGSATPLAVADGGNALLVRVLAAAVIAGFDDLVLAVTAAVLLGVLDESAVWVSARTTVVDVIVAAAVLVALLLRRESFSRATGSMGSWLGASAGSVAIPARIRRWAPLPLIALAAAAPLALPPSEDHGLALVAVTALLGIAVVVITGWAGQVTLAALSLAGVGGAVSSVLYGRHGWDATLAAGAGIAAAAVASVLLGLPALRVRTPVLSVSTLAFATAASSWLLVGRVHPWLVDDQLARPELFGRLSLAQEWQTYELCLAGLVLGWVVAARARRSRAGRNLLAVRDDSTLAAAHGIRVAASRAGACALSGALAGLAGCLLVVVQQGFLVDAYSPEASTRVLAGAVVGGITSLPGAVLGAAFVRACEVLLPSDWSVLATGAGLAGLVLLFPEGAAGALSRVVASLSPAQP